MKVKIRLIVHDLRIFCVIYVDSAQIENPSFPDVVRGDTDEINRLPLPSPIVTRILVHVLTVSEFVSYWVYSLIISFTQN